MGLVEVPIVLGRGLFAFLRDFHRHALCGAVQFLPLCGFAYALRGLLIFLYGQDPVLVLIVAGGWAGGALSLWIGAIVKGIDQRLHGSAPEIVDLLEVMFTRLLTRAALGLLSAVLALCMFVGIYAVVEGLGWEVSHFAIRCALLLSLTVFAVTSWVVVLEHAGPWGAVSRCFSLARGRPWFTIVSLVAATLLANGIYLGLRLIYLAWTGTAINGWPKLAIVLFVVALVAAMAAAVIHHLRAFEESRSHQTLADHFD